MPLMKTGIKAVTGGTMTTANSGKTRAAMVMQAMKVTPTEACVAITAGEWAMKRDMEI